MIIVAMSYFCRQNVSQISLEIVANCSHPSEILAKSTDTDEMTTYVAFHLGVHCCQSTYSGISGPPRVMGSAVYCRLRMPKLKAKTWRTRSGI